MSACEACSRKGILIYPVRYAIACPAGADGVPGLSGNFQVENAPADIGKAKYTLRSMRAGYMYVYDEKRKRLRAYVVMPHGLLSSFPLEYLAPNPSTIPPNPCTNQAEITFTRCIDIVHAARDPATNLWIGWSSVVWTKALIAKVEDVAWRRKHMQCINVPELLAGTAAHSAEFAQHYKEIAHFGAERTAMLKAFAFSNTSVGHEVKQHDRGASIVETMAEHGPYNKGFIVALNDPVGITNDLSELTLPTVDAGFDEDLARGKMAYDMLGMAEKSIRDEARRGVVVDENIAKHYEDNPEHGGDMYNSAKTLWKIMKAGGPDKYAAKKRAEKKKYGDDQVARQDAAADEAWEALSTEEKAGKRISFLDKDRFRNFPQTYAKAINEFQPQYVQLVRAHIAWLTSEQLANWMEGVHDSKDIRSGYAFNESLAQCIGKGVSGESCQTQLLGWLNKGTIRDPRNLYARAMFYNQEELINVSGWGVKGSDIQYENVLNLYKLTLIRLKRGDAAKLKDRLALTTANILVSALKESSYSAMQSMAKLHVTLVGKAHISKNLSSPAELGAWVFDQAKRSGVQFKQSETKARNAAHREADRIIRNTPPQSVIAYEIDVKSLASEGVINEHTIKGVKVPGFDLTKKWLGSAAPNEFHLGVATTIIQMLALGFVVQDMANEDSFNKDERNYKGVTAIVGLSATLVEMVAATVETAPTHPLAAFLPIQWAVDAERLKLVVNVAKVIGCAAGVATGVYDIWCNAQDAWRGEKKLLGTLYGANGILGILVAFAGYFGWAIFWPSLILSFIVGITIALISNNAFQDWMSRCYFSNGVSLVRAATHGKPPFRPYPYPAANDEFNAFKSAMGM